MCIRASASVLQEGTLSWLDLSENIIGCKRLATLWQMHCIWEDLLRDVPKWRLQCHQHEMVQRQSCSWISCAAKPSSLPFQNLLPNMVGYWKKAISYCAGRLPSNPRHSSQVCAWCWQWLWGVRCACVANLLLAGWESASWKFQLWLDTSDDWARRHVQPGCCCSSEGMPKVSQAYPIRHFCRVPIAPRQSYLRNKPVWELWVKCG